MEFHLLVWDFYFHSNPSTTGLGVLGANSNFMLQKIRLKKPSVHLNAISNQCAASCNERTHLRVLEGGEACAKENCIYKLFKLYEMHVVIHGYLSLYDV